MAANVSEEAAEFEEFYNTARFATGLVVYPAVCLLGLAGNTLILGVLTSKSFSVTSTDIYLAALAVSDSAKLASDSLYFVTCLLMETNPRAGNRAFAWLYPYAHFVFNASVCVSSWLTVSVSVERYILVCHPARSKMMTSVARSKTVSLAVFFLMTLVALPSAFRYKTVVVPRHLANYNGTRHLANDSLTTVVATAETTEFGVELTPLWQNVTFARVYNWLQSLLRSIVPLCVLVVTSCFITGALWKTRANKKMASRNRITLMLTIVVTFFIVCILPDAVMSALYLGYTESGSYLVRGIREVTDALLAVNAAVNFFLYVVFNRRFKSSFVRQFCCCVARTRTAVDPVGEGGGGGGGVTTGGLLEPQSAAVKSTDAACQRLLEVRKAGDDRGPVSGTTKQLDCLTSVESVV